MEGSHAGAEKKRGLTHDSTIAASDQPQISQVIVGKYQDNYDSFRKQFSKRIQSEDKYNVFQNQEKRRSYERVQKSPQVSKPAFKAKAKQFLDNLNEDRDSLTMRSKIYKNMMAFIGE